jgi:hypothetical protein
MTTTFIILNVILAVAAVAAVHALVVLSHRLPASAPHHDELWGTGGDPWIPSDPLPLHQVSTLDDDREQVRAA